MGDIYCAKCGEPWDYWGVYSALKHDDGDMTKEEAERFMRGEGCPVCKFGEECPTCRYVQEYNEPYHCPNPACGYLTDIGHVLEWDEKEKKYVKKVCPICKGKGYVDTCPVCLGTGKPDRKGNLRRFIESVIENTDDPDIIDQMVDLILSGR